MTKMLVVGWKPKEYQLVGKISYRILTVGISTLLSIAVIAYYMRDYASVLQTDLIIISSTIKDIKTDTDNIRGDVESLKLDVESIQADVDDIEGFVRDIKGDVYDINRNLKILMTEVSSIEANMVLVTANVALIWKQFTNLLTRFTVVDEISSGVALIAEDLAKSIVVLTAIEESSAGAASTLIEVATTDAEILTQLVDAEAILTESAGILADILTAVSIPLLERLNLAVSSMEVRNTDWTYIDLDACEYDPLGFGPINCNGLEMESGIIKGIVFL